MSDDEILETLYNVWWWNTWALYNVWWWNTWALYNIMSDDEILEHYII